MKTEPAEVDYIDGAKTRIVAQLRHLRTAMLQQRDRLVIQGWLLSIESELCSLKRLLLTCDAYQQGHRMPDKLKDQ